MKVAIVGDLHGLYTRVNDAAPDTELAIQVGDFGYTNLNSPLKYTFKFKTYFIAGNHDSIDTLKYISDNENKIGLFSDKLWYIPRGWVELIGNKLVGFLGGADTPSPYRAQLIPNVTLFRGEATETYDLYRLQNNLNAWNRVYNKGGDRGLDVLITHTPPTSIMAKMVSPVYERQSSHLVERAVMHFKPAIVYFGHMHVHYEDTIGNTKLVGLDINEIIQEEW